MRADTVAEAVAAHYGLSKAELLDSSGAAGGRGEEGEAGGGRRGGGGDSAAVRLALGEAQVIAATKQALAEAGGLRGVVWRGVGCEWVSDWWVRVRKGGKAVRVVLRAGMCIAAWGVLRLTACQRSGSWEAWLQGRVPLDSSVGLCAVGSL